MSTRPAEFSDAMLERLYELLSDERDGTLTPEAQAELARLLDNPAARAAAEEFEAAHAAMLLAFKDAAPARMPEDAKSRLEAVGVAIVNPAPARSVRTGGGFGWAAAAVLAIVAAIGWLRPAPAPVAPSTPAPPVAVTPSLAERLAALLREDGTATVQLAAQSEPAAAGASGQAVWNNRVQKGFLRLRGLPSNDPTKEQYQLWIFDAQRETYPIDGGVFDLSQASVDPETGDLIVPMDPALRVNQPVAIAVTLERPGGVVVTTKERLVLLGNVQ